MAVVVIVIIIVIASIVTTIDKHIIYSLYHAVFK